MKTQTTIVTLSLILIAFCSNKQSAAAQEKIKFPVGVGTKTIGTNMFWLATKKGLFDEFGLDVQSILLRGSSITMQALVSESLYLALSQQPNWIVVDFNVAGGSRCQCFTFV